MCSSDICTLIIYCSNGKYVWWMNVVWVGVLGDNGYANAATFCELFSWSVLVVGLCACMCAGGVLLVLVQWAGLCIRQVELQGEFRNTWPVSLSHLCGWRKKNKDEGERRREGQRLYKQLGVMGGSWATMRSDQERGRRKQQLGEPEGGTNCDDSAFIFLSLYFLRLNLSPIPPSLSII